MNTTFGVRFVLRASSIAVSLSLLQLPAFIALADAPLRLPVSQVVLFNTGMGFFEHAGTVDGNQLVELRFNEADMNDVLKSLMVEDAQGGRVTCAQFPTKEPFERTLRKFAFDLTGRAATSDLLAQIRGERIEVDADGLLTGQIVNVERRTKRLREDQGEDGDWLTLLTDEGLRAVCLDDVKRVRLLDDRLNRELQQALAVLANGREANKKLVSVQFDGAGLRRVRLGYVQESPVWKTSYRLLLKDDGAAKVQVWAVVENNTQHDWDGIALALVAGRPISFIMDLYQPLYAPRPIVEPDVFAGLVPPRYDVDRLSRDKLLANDAAGLEPGVGAATKPNEADTEGPVGGGFGGGGGMGGGMVAGPSRQRQYEGGFNSRAQTDDLGVFFQYSIDGPVSLGHGQSALLPIVQADVEAQRLSVYNTMVHAVHPLSSVRLTNTTDKHLMEGPLTVFDGASYGGDSRIDDLAPQGQRLLSYAIDLDVECEVKSVVSENRLVNSQRSKGTLHFEYRQQRTTEYAIRNVGAEDRTLLIEHPLETAWKLLSPPDPAELTADQRRFEVIAKKRSLSSFEVEEERAAHSTLRIEDLTEDALKTYLADTRNDEPVNGVLREVAARRARLAELVKRRDALKRKLNEAKSEQERIRLIREPFTDDSALQLRLGKKMDTLETAIETTLDEMGRLNAEESTELTSLKTFLESLEQ